jgi:hypothetical protein
MTSIVIIAPINLLHDAPDGKQLALGLAVGSDGIITIPLYQSGVEAPTHYAGHAAGGQDMSGFAAAFRGLYDGSMPPPDGVASEGLATILDAITVSVDGEVFGRTGNSTMPGAPLSGRAHYDAVVSHLGLLTTSDVVSEEEPA